MRELAESTFKLVVFSGPEFFKALANPTPEHKDRVNYGSEEDFERRKAELDPNNKFCDFSF